MAAASWNWGTFGDEVVKEFAGLIKDKTILVTGVASGGLGGETAITLSKAHPKLIILHARSEDKISPIAKAVAEQGVPSKSVVMDLASFASVRKAAETVNSWADVTIDVMINCAGVMATPYGKTADGFEQQFGINHLGHFLFTNLLLKAGKVADGGRIVNVTSGGHMRSPIRWDDVNFSDGAEYDKYAGYGQSKTANILYSIALADKLKGHQIASFSVHPGVIITNLGRYQSKEELEALIAATKSLSHVSKYNFNYKELNQGVSSQIMAAFSPGILDQNGAYIYDCQIQEAAEHARSLEDANRLWAMSEEMVGEKFKF
ncbi:hypothetical protein Dda_7274 [Drechslerella dactyloides]|uniref:NAD(P)-binding protein n=1 Tax=Drechslerella dactyloides TaxID=74499 RepID=A0AAD6IRZ3_DREDA|nr:hypothetical protein Dda_7274 [Drechslerella dactyloides]